MSALSDIQEARATMQKFLDEFQKSAYQPVMPPGGGGGPPPPGGGAPMPPGAGAPPPPGAPMPPGAGGAPPPPGAGVPPPGAGAAPSASPEELEQGMIQIFTTLEQLMPVVEGVKKENEELKASLKSNEQSVMELKAQVSQLEKVLSNPMGVNG